MAERRLSNWLKGYAEYTDGTESPPSFHLWVGLSTIAAAAQRKIFLDADYYQVHSNLFMILVSPPGRSRKSTALRIGKNILKKVAEFGQDINFSTQASSVAALVKALATIAKEKANIEHQSITAFSSELGSLLGSKSVEMTDFLTDIYDCEPDWDKQTVGRGLEQIPRPWLNLVAATTPQWLGDNLSRTAVEGGFVARSIFVFEDQRLLVAFPELTAEQKNLRIHLAHDLSQIASLRGKFTFSGEGKEYYRYWYENLNKATSTDLRLSGYYERRHIHVLKVAMLVSLSENQELILDKADIEAAIMMLEEIEPGMHRAFSAVGKNIHSTDIERIKHQILDTGEAGIEYRKLLSSNIHSVEKPKFDELIQSLVDMGDIVHKGTVLIMSQNAGERTYVRKPLVRPSGGSNGRSEPARDAGIGGDDPPEKDPRAVGEG